MRVVADCENKECGGYKSRLLNLPSGTDARIISMVKREDKERIAFHNRTHGRYVNYRLIRD